MNPATLIAGSGASSSSIGVIAAGITGTALIVALVYAGYRIMRATEEANEAERKLLRTRQAAHLASIHPASGSLPADALRQAADHAMARSEDRLSSLTAAAEHETAAVLQGLRLPRPDVTYLPTQPAAWRG